MYPNARRNEPRRKENLLLKRTLELTHAIQGKFLTEKIQRPVEKYRAAQTSLIKAKFHLQKTVEGYQYPNSPKINKLVNGIIAWNDKTLDQIIAEFME